MSTIVPWTNLGGSPCCCPTGCGSVLIDFLWDIFDIQKWQRVNLTADQYLDIRALGLKWITQSYVVGNHPLGGTIVSQNPTSVTYVNVMTFPTITFQPQGIPSDRCFGNLQMFNQATAVSIFNEVGAQATVGIFGPVVIAVLQENTQGLTGIDRPLQQPALYLQGVVNRSSYPNIGAFGSWTIDGTTATNIGTVFNVPSSVPLWGFYDTNNAATRVVTTTTITLP